MAAIRECIAEVYDEATAEAIRIQYGGSVNAGNAAELFAQARHRWWSGRWSFLKGRLRKDRKLQIKKNYCHVKQ